MPEIKLSIIVPVYNEERCLQERCTKYIALEAQGVEVVLVDGGSSDYSSGIIKQHDLKLVRSTLGRAKQMNTGARECRGNSILFLHADSDLPENIGAYIDSIVQADWGFFYLSLSNETWRYRLISSSINFRSALFGVATGDQGIFVNADLFRRVGGYTEIALMEDIDLSRRLKKLHPPLVIRNKIITSARRWESRGVLKTICLMWFMQLAFKLGISPERLRNWYR